MVDLDSVGVHLDCGEWPAAEVVVFRGGWAGVDIVDLYVEPRGIVTEAPDVADAAALAES